MFMNTTLIPSKNSPFSTLNLETGRVILCLSPTNQRKSKGPKKIKIKAKDKVKDNKRKSKSKTKKTKKRKEKKIKKEDLLGMKKIAWW